MNATCDPRLRANANITKLDINPPTHNETLHGEDKFSPVSSSGHALDAILLCEERHNLIHELADDVQNTKDTLISRWRMRERMKTMSVALLLCLNVGVDPPDMLKISPCARLECWINPLAMQPQKALEAIGKALQTQYDRWQPRARYKMQLDPTVEDVKKLCVACRRNAKNERVLLHYNGHGVPRPTINGEIWVFNRSYTQYIPLSVHDLLGWTGAPSIFVLDCSAAGLIVNAFIHILKRRQQEEYTYKDEVPQTNGKPICHECILLAACSSAETLPQSAELPADIFSSCLTTPIKVALRWFCLRTPLKGEGVDLDLVDKIPGQQNNRKTPLGELNWIFTAITDTIAWNVLPRPLFQRLFRQDLLVASLFRNFLLADRILRSCNCTPISCPRLPPTYQHPMWQSWDLALEMCLLQMPAVISGNESVDFHPSNFFTEQLTAFEVWLDNGSERRAPPEQLPIVLQVLLSQSHRLRALVLLGRFLDMGSWAVDLALSVGIFPYVLKLLQTTAPDLRQVLVFIWTKILALDRTCQLDLVKDGGHIYFTRYLETKDAEGEQRAMAAFVLSSICDGHRKGQEACTASGLVSVCLQHIPHAANSSHYLLKWLCICLAKVCEDYYPAQSEGLRLFGPSILAQHLKNPHPEVRAAATSALNSLISSKLPPESTDNSDQATEPQRMAADRLIACHLLQSCGDASPLVRSEVVTGLGKVVRSHELHFNAEALAWIRKFSGDVLSFSEWVILDHITSTSLLYSMEVEPPCVSQQSALTSLPTAYDSAAYCQEESGERVGNDSFENDTAVGSVSIAANGRGGFATADAARVGGGLYTHLLKVLIVMSADPAPQVSQTSHFILSEARISGPFNTSLRLSTSHPYHKSDGVYGKSLMRAVTTQQTLNSKILKEQQHTEDANVCSSPEKLLSKECKVHVIPLQQHSSDDNNSLTPKEPCSTIFEFCCQYFARPLLDKHGEITNGGEEDDDRACQWCRLPRTQIRLERRAHANQLAHNAIQTSAKLSHVVSSIELDGAGSSALVFNSLSSLLYIGDGQGTVTCWDYAEGNVCNRFQAVSGTVANMHVMNNLDNPMLIALSSNSEICVWREPMKQAKERLATAWRAFPANFDQLCGTRANMRIKPLSCWQQVSGRMFTALGHHASPLLRVWDVSQELCVDSISLRLGVSTDTSSKLSCISDAVGNLILAGTEGGSVLSIDLRSPAKLINVLRPHTSYAVGVSSVQSSSITNVSLQPHGLLNEVVTASSTGELNFFDLRAKGDPYNTVRCSEQGLQAACAHSFTSMTAVSTLDRQLKIFDNAGRHRALLKHGNRFLVQRSMQVSLLAFHPYRSLLASSTTDGHITVWA
mmetsp:Transcript_10736/g.37275  ORF Transcript_10736/g.37275 Transcript_10736/m.37275 type:complete len:1349 (-) Transcript_10736:143-4189(-)|eukprot:CAMPEP_0183797142 /NCGR_PEP_ID=MMETSP0803_2-20130417/14684_1 /TAXON_ID=195967 /ORGANISM="Crustomastix stigmata, Strain CCMP3273" /LENGTH=1348 /DNA_ID=CAMNT_0026041803 /DNA_START=270 /DNA_END=4316 /DNA_ORIENTATION=+